MVDPVTGGILVAGGMALQNALGRVVGPAADEVAVVLARFTKHRLENVARVTEVADRLSGDKPGAVPMRVAMRVFEEGSYSDDEMVVQYLGGVLASSRTPFGRDDRGNTYTALVSRLSTYHLRTHYIWYSEWRRLLLGTPFNIFLEVERQSLGVMFMPFSSYAPAMDFEDTEDAEEIFRHSVFALERESLSQVHTAGNVDHVRKRYPNAPEPGMVVVPTVQGAELFLWGMGQGQRGAAALLDQALGDLSAGGVVVPPGAVLVKDLPPRDAQAVGDPPDA